MKTDESLVIHSSANVQKMKLYVLQAGMASASRLLSDGKFEGKVECF
jgi:hypothetical protein